MSIDRLADRSRKKLLVADDDENLRGLLRVLFEETGYEIHEAATGQQALEQIERLQPDLILLDVHFGGNGALSGHDVLHEVRRDAICMDVPVILLTGLATEEQVVRGFEAGADDYVSKPFSPRELLARVESRVKRHQDTKLRLRSQSDLRPGKTVRGAQGAVYEIGSPISRGGMGVVFRATCLDTGNPVCIKTLENSRRRRNKDLRRFELEAHAALRFDHPNLARGIDLKISQDACFLVMEYVEGETLASRVNRSGPLEQAEGISVALQICSALAHIDSHDMVHRDVKPENILLSPDGGALLVDFGLTKSTSDDGPGLTTDGIILGTPYYISPEQVKGMLRLDVRSDIYCLGAALYFALSGKKPFDGNSTVSIINQRLISDPVSVTVANPAISSGLSRVVAKMMSRSLTRRYKSPPDVRVDLRRLQEGQEPLLASASEEPYLDWEAVR